MHRTQPDGDPTRSGERAADLLQGQVGLPGNQLQHRRAVLAQPAATVAAHRARARMALALQLHFWRGVLIFSRMVGRGWMSGASIEETLELWAASLREVKARMRPLFTQDRVAASAGLFLDGLLGEERRKTGWMRAEAAGDPGPWRQQAILGRGRWDADVLRDLVREYVIEHLADEGAVLVVDETGFLKQGKASCGVGRQYTGSAGKITNCQIGVFAAYVSRRGHGFIDRALYLPQTWTSDPARMAGAHMPPDTGFATKPALALAMIDRARDAGVPFAWVTADAVYGTGAVEMALRRAGKAYFLGVSATSQFNSWGAKPPVAGTAVGIAAALDPSAWHRLSAGAGSKGERLFDWAYLELA